MSWSFSCCARSLGVWVIFVIYIAVVALQVLTARILNRFWLHSLHIKNTHDSKLQNAVKYENCIQFSSLRAIMRFGSISFLFCCCRHQMSLPTSWKVHITHTHTHDCQEILTIRDQRASVDKKTQPVAASRSKSQQSHSQTQHMHFKRLSWHWQRREPDDYKTINMLTVNYYH